MERKYLTVYHFHDVFSLMGLFEAIRRCLGREQEDEPSQTSLLYELYKPLSPKNVYLLLKATASAPFSYMAIAPQGFCSVMACPTAVHNTKATPTAIQTEPNILASETVSRLTF
ncbi:MAG TPA: hypothetical protein VFF49_02950 [Thermodesulfobacteriota bacterium]|nr:hypothetical protein [Thermodesulfobacteriota bacterium]